MGLRIVRDAEDADPQEADLLAEYIAARRAYEQAERHYKELGKQHTEEKAQKHQKSMTLTSEGKAINVTYVQKTSYDLDEKGLRRALTAKVFDSYTEKKLNRKALEEAMSRQDVDPTVVAKYVSEKPSTPYLRYTEKDIEEL